MRSLQGHSASPATQAVPFTPATLQVPLSLALINPSALEGQHSTSTSAVPYTLETLAAARDLLLLSVLVSPVVQEPMVSVSAGRKATGYSSVPRPSVSSKGELVMMSQSWSSLPWYWSLELVGTAPPCSPDSDSSSSESYIFHSNRPWHASWYYPVMDLGQAFCQLLGLLVSGRCRYSGPSGTHGHFPLHRVLDRDAPTRWPLREEYRCLFEQSLIQAPVPDQYSLPGAKTT